MKPENSPDNYEKWCTEWQQRFLTLDQDRLLHQIPGLDADGDYLTLSYYHSRYGIRRDTGEILCLEDPHPLTIFTRLNLYTLLWYCTEHAALTGEWMPFRSLKNASPFGPAFQKTVTDVFAKTFSGHLPELEQSCRTLGGKKLPHSDAGYQIDAFACIPVQFLFWDRDEEFPAQANILFDRGATGFIHVESLVSVASEGLSLLTKASGLSPKGNTFT